MGGSNRAVLRLGYAAVIGILVFSTLQAYRIQGIVSEQHVDIYRQYVEQDEAISQLRRTIWLAGNNVRDFFLSAHPDRAALLKSQLQDLHIQGRHALSQLDRLQPNQASTRLLKASLREYWAKLEPIPETMAAVQPQSAYQFIQQEIVPRRNALYDAFQQITDTDQRTLRRSEIQFADKRQDAARKLLFLLTLCVVLGFLVAGFSLHHAGRLEREAIGQYEQVTQAKREMEELSARLLDIEEEDRRRLSRELHDEIGQTLAVLAIELSHAQSLAGHGQERIRERLDRARELADKTVQTVRNISLLLRPALLDDLGLVPALQWLLEDFERRSGLSCTFSEDGVQDLLPDSVKTCVFRVVQEALHNCEKHAGASQIRGAVEQSAVQMRVEVEDNGRGLELNRKGMPRRNAGLGILGMRERAARVGGALTVNSSPGLGTLVCLQIPLTELAGQDRRAAVAETGVNA